MKQNKNFLGHGQIIYKSQIESILKGVNPFKRIYLQRNLHQYDIVFGLVKLDDYDKKKDKNNVNQEDAYKNRPLIVMSDGYVYANVININGSNEQKKCVTVVPITSVKDEDSYSERTEYKFSVSTILNKTLNYEYNSFLSLYDWVNSESKPVIDVDMLTDILMDNSNTKPQRLPDEDLDIIRYGEALWEKNHSDNKDDLKDIKAIIAKRKKLNNNAKKTILPPLTADTPVHSYVDTLNTAKKEILEQYKKDNDLQKVYESVARLDTSIDNKILILQDILPDDYDEGVLMTTIALHLFERAAQRFL